MSDVESNNSTGPKNLTTGKRVLIPLAALVVVFGDTATMLITSLLLVVIAKPLWKAPLLLVIPVGIMVLSLDATLFCANLSKFASGGWIVVVMASIITLLMTTWIAGRKLLQQTAISAAIRLEEFAQQRTSSKVIRTPKTAVFLSSNAAYVPRSLLHNFKHNGTLPAINLITCVQTEEIPYVNPEEKCSLTDCGQGLYKVILRYGYMEIPDIPNAIARFSSPLLPRKDPLQLSFYLGKESLVLKQNKNMASWRKELFLLMSRNALDASAFFNRPPNRVVELGAQVEFSEKTFALTPDLNLGRI